MLALFLAEASAATIESNQVDKKASPGRQHGCERWECLHEPRTPARWLPVPEGVASPVPFLFRSLSARRSRHFSAGLPEDTARGRGPPVLTCPQPPRDVLRELTGCAVAKRLRRRPARGLGQSLEFAAFVNLLASEQSRPVAGLFPTRHPTKPSSPASKGKTSKL